MNKPVLSFHTRRPFGVELELGREVARHHIVDFVNDNSYKNVKSSYYRPSINNNYWDIKHDGSCGSKCVKGINEGGFEVASYKASGWQDLLHISSVLSNLKKIGAKVNHNCGLHIHVDVSDYSIDCMGVFISYWLVVEYLFFSMVPSYRKHNKFCLRICNQKIDRKNLNEPLDFWNNFKPKSTNLNNSDRRFSVNLLNYHRAISLKTFKRKTLEFRMPESSLVNDNIKNWIRLFVNFVENVKSYNVCDKKEPIADIVEFLDIIGLNSHEFELSEGLSETRNWVLKRLGRYATNVNIKKEAKKLLIQEKI